MLDIGAHTGTYAISLEQYFKKIYAFEPQKMTYYALCGGVALSCINNIECIKCGLGSSEQVGINKLNIVSIDGGGSSIHKNNNSILAVEDIEIKTLDSFNIDNIGFIKMDVEDNELYVLKGGIETLKRSNWPKILFEMNVYNKDLINFLIDYKYKIIKLQNTNNMYLAEI